MRARRGMRFGRSGGRGRGAVAGSVVVLLLSASLTLLTGPSAFAATADAYEPDDGIELATPVALGGAAQQRTVYPDWDDDWLSFEATAGTTYVIETTDGTPAEALGLSVGVYDAAEDWLDGGSNYDGTAVLVEHRAETSGTRYVQVDSAWGTDMGYATTGSYAVAVRALPPVGEVSVPASVDLGAVPTGTVVERTIQVSNVGVAPVDVLDVVLNARAPGFSIVADEASGTSIQPGGSADVVVRYAPNVAPSGEPTAEPRTWTNLAATYSYSGGVVVGATLYSGFENLGGSGDLDWRVQACQPDTSDCTAVFDETGTAPVLGGARYLVTTVVGAMAGSGVVGLLEPVVESTSLAARPTGLQSLTYTRVPDAFLDVESNADEQWATTELFGLPTSSPSSPSPPSQPDGKISKLRTAGYIGNDIYNTTAEDQTKKQKASRTEARTFYVRVQNDGTVRDTFRLRAGAPRAGSKVRYVVDGVDVTKALRSDLGLEVVLAPTKQELVKVRIMILRTAKIGSKKPALVTARWSGDSVRVDAVKAVVKVVR